MLIRETGMRPRIWMVNQHHGYSGVGASQTTLYKLYPNGCDKFNASPGSFRTMYLSPDTLYLLRSSLLLTKGSVNKERPRVLEASRHSRKATPGSSMQCKYSFQEPLSSPVAQAIQGRWWDNGRPMGKGWEKVYLNHRHLKLPHKCHFHHRERWLKSICLGLMWIRRF